MNLAHLPASLKRAFPYERMMRSDCPLLTEPEPLDLALDLLMSIAQEEYPHFCIDQENLPAYTLALAWLLGLEHPDIDDHMKGLYISGNAGSGKTTLVRLLHLVSQSVDLHRPFYSERQGRFVYERMLWWEGSTALGIAQHYAEQGELQGLYARLLHIGDLGAEPEETLHWGTRTRPLSDLICQRSDLGGYLHAPMIITSNYRPEDLRQRYGDRAASRLVGDCIHVQLTGADRRRKR